MLCTGEGAQRPDVTLSPRHCCLPSGTSNKGEEGAELPPPCQGMCPAAGRLAALGGALLWILSVPQRLDVECWVPRVAGSSGGGAWWESPGHWGLNPLLLSLLPSGEVSFLHHMVLPQLDSNQEPEAMGPTQNWEPKWPFALGIDCPLCSHRGRAHVGKPEMALHWAEPLVRTSPQTLSALW